MGDRIDELLEGFYRFEKSMEEKMDTVNIKIDKLDSRMDNLEARMDNLEGGMNNLEIRMDSLEGRMDEQEKRIDTLIVNIGKRFDRVDQKLEELAKREGKFFTLLPNISTCLYFDLGYFPEVRTYLKMLLLTKHSIVSFLALTERSWILKTIRGLCRYDDYKLYKAYKTYK